MTWEIIEPKRPSILAYTNCEHPWLQIFNLDDIHIQKACQIVSQMAEFKLTVNSDVKTGAITKMSGDRQSVVDAYQAINNLATHDWKRSQSNFEGAFLRATDCIIVSLISAIRPSSPPFPWKNLNDRREQNFHT